MADFEMNSLVDRIQTLDTFVQIKVGSDNYRLKSLQDIDPVFRWPNLVRVADDGSFYLNQTVIEHQHSILLRLTADEVDTANPPTNVRTASYWIYQKNLRNSVVLTIVMVGFAKEASSNKYVRLTYSFEVEEVGIPRLLNDGGDVALRVTGRILNNATYPISFIRSAS